MHTKYGRFPGTQQVKANSLRGFSKVSLCQDFVITLGKDYPNAIQAISCERCPVCGTAFRHNEIIPIIPSLKRFLGLSRGSSIAC